MGFLIGGNCVWILSPNEYCVFFLLQIEYIGFCLPAAPVAQLAEHPPCKRKVRGSIPRRSSIKATPVSQYARECIRIFQIDRIPPRNCSGNSCFVLPCFIWCAGCFPHWGWLGTLSLQTKLKPAFAGNLVHDCLKGVSPDRVVFKATRYMCLGEPIDFHRWAPFS